MITKKLLLTVVLGTATLLSSSSFAFTHAHPSQQSIRFNHHHPSAMRHSIFHRWIPARSYVVVHARHPHSWRHHYHH